jgi:Tfp pilus assembly protein PilO
VIGLTAVGGGNGSHPRARSLWRSRAALFAALGVLLLATAAVLVVYHGFYDARLAALEETRSDLTRQREAAQAAADRSAETERRLAELKASLDAFYGGVLGTRKERLASLIEDVDAITREAGFMPSTVAYSEDAVPGAARLTVSFRIEGRYADVKKLLYEFEASPKFLVPERVQVSLDENAPDILRVALSVAHYFRGEGPRAPKRPARTAAAPKTAAPAVAVDKAVPE